MASHELMSKKERRIQKALGTLPMQACVECGRDVPKDRIQYTVGRRGIILDGMIGVCESCRRMHV